MTEKTTLEIIAPTVEEAIAQGLAQLGLTADAVSVEVLDAGNKGLFGLGKPQVRVRLTVNPVGGPPAVQTEAPRGKVLSRRAATEGRRPDTPQGRVEGSAGAEVETPQPEAERVATKPAAAPVIASPPKGKEEEAQ